MRLFIIILTILPLIFANHAAAEALHPVTQNSAREKILITVPDICIKNESESHCSIKLNVKVQFPTKTNFCLIAKEIALKECYWDLKLLEQVLHLNVSNSVYFTVTNHEEDVLAAQFFNVANIKSKRTRPRRNLGWILF
ncbi:DUF3019 domain-containing protein [Psychrosphaera sp. F3M07]|uniref:DUF3019 domain-containing protein n=1 Tax=Psychrosphaera sp. F3M07 TaxID=2841560 RepID=UPI001C092DA3|nr:DUF3019 domain-containing protein [Psychrosphaera sp. F3M07]MBU2917321.1 DUF3019 domain-containing protein [Psychrosphaera sp. F3M07]